MNEDKKKQFVDQIQSVKILAQESIKLHQNGLLSARHVCDIAEAAEDYVENLTGNNITGERWDEHIKVWINAGSHVKEFNEYQSNAPNMTYVDSILSTNVSGMTIEVGIPTQNTPGAIVAPSTEYNRLEAVLEQGSYYQIAIDQLKRLKLEKEWGTIRSPSRLLADSMNSYEIPASDDMSASSVLIPLREAINNSIALLLKKRSKQGRTRKRSEKIQSIYDQLKYNNIPQKDVDSIIDEYERVIDNLSESKSTTMTRNEIHIRFIHGCSFLSSFLNMIDENRFNK